MNVGRFTKQKNHKLLIKAFHIFLEKNKKYKLLIFGQGSEKKSLQKYISELGLRKNIELKNWQKDLSIYFNKAKIFISTSLYEGMPNALIESINHEIPSISTDVSGVDDILIKEKEGDIIKSFDEKIIASKIHNILKNYKKSKLKALNSKKRIFRFYIQNAGKEYMKKLISN